MLKIPKSHATFYVVYTMLYGKANVGWVQFAIIRPLDYLILAVRFDKHRLLCCCTILVFIVLQHYVLCTIEPWSSIDIILNDSVSKIISEMPMYFNTTTI